MNEEIKNITIDPFTGLPHVQVTKKEVTQQRRAGGADMSHYYTRTQVDALLDDVEFPDEAYSTKTLRMCDWSFGAYNDSIWNLGTGGAAKMKYTRVGRTVEGWIGVKIASDATTPSGFFIIVHPDDLPYTPKIESASTGYPQPGGFGAIYKADTNGSEPYNGYRHGLSPIVQEISNGISIMMFFKTGSENAIAGGADNTWSPLTSQPVAPASLKGAQYFGYFKYEAASAL